MFFSVFYAIPPGFTTWNLSEKELEQKWHALLNSGLFQRANLQSMPRTEYLLYGSENGTQYMKDCTLTNTFGITKFESVTKNL